MKQINFPEENFETLFDAAIFLHQLARKQLRKELIEEMKGKIKRKEELGSSLKETPAIKGGHP